MLLGRGDGTFRPGIEAKLERGGWAPITVSDFNGDGKADLTLIGGDISILLGLGDGRFKPEITFKHAARIARVDDFNRDGKTDFAVVHMNSDSDDSGLAYVSVLLNSCAPSVPELTVARTGRAVTLSWPLPSAGFVLEVSATLEPSGWRTLPDAGEIKRGRLEFTPPMATLPLRFYRLRKP